MNDVIQLSGFNINGRIFYLIPINDQYDRFEYFSREWKKTNSGYNIRVYNKDGNYLNYYTKPLYTLYLGKSTNNNDKFPWTTKVGVDRSFGLTLLESVGNYGCLVFRKVDEELLQSIQKRIKKYFLDQEYKEDFDNQYEIELPFYEEIQKYMNISDFRRYLSTIISTERLIKVTKTGSKKHKYLHKL